LKVRFGTAGIRGLTWTEVTPQVCDAVSRALARYHGGSGGYALVRDTRPGAAELAGVCASALAESGMTVRNLGVAPSPVLCARVSAEGLAGGLAVTGSHLPFDRIGLIPVGADGTLLPPAETRKIERAVEGIQARPTAQASALPPEAPDVEDCYVRFIESAVGDRDAGKGMTVALDAGCGGGAGFVRRVLRRLGFETVAVNDEPAEVAPRRMEPRAGGVPALIQLVRDAGADFGAAYDADCDRVLFVDGRGRELSEDLSAAIFAKHLYGLGPGTLVMPVNSSGLLRRYWRGNVEWCRMGPPEISSAMRRSGAVFGYEESGKYFFAPAAPWADGILATAMMGKIMSASSAELGKLADEFPNYHQVKENVRSTPERISKALEMARSDFRPDGAALTDIDGLKYEFADGAWLLLRASGTEPLLRVYTDAPSAERARELAKLGVETAKRYVEAD
jgi:phosphomannomutase